MAIIREGAALSPALGFEVLEVQPEAWLGTCTSILSIRMPGPPSFSGFLSSYLLTIAFLYLSPWQCHRPGVHGPAGGRGGKGQGQEAVCVHVPLLGSETPTGEGGPPSRLAVRRASCSAPGQFRKGARSSGAAGGGDFWRLKDLFGSLQGPQLPALAAWALEAAG